MKTNGSLANAGRAIKNARPQGRRMAQEEVLRRMGMLAEYIHGQNAAAKAGIAKSPDDAYRDMKKILLQGKEPSK